MRTYEIKAGDTLRSIAKAYYDDPGTYRALADFNGILDPHRIFVGQILEIPTRGILLDHGSTGNGLTPPHGLQQIRQTFGDIYRYLSSDGTLKPSFESRYLSRTRLPFPIPLSWNPAISVRRLYAHKELGPVFRDVFEAVEREGLKKEIRTFGGCFNFRSKRSSGRLSTHCWGIAIDLNPETNQMGTAGNMHPEITALFREFGFSWGGGWTGRAKDPMHFQFCTGY